LVCAWHEKGLVTGRQYSGDIKNPDLKESFRMKYLAYLFIVIISLLLFFAAVNHFVKNPPKQLNHEDMTKIQISLIEAAIDMYQLNTGKYPDTLKDLIVCPVSVTGKWTGPCLKDIQLYDPWNRPFIYEPNTADPNRYVLISYGKDGKPGGENYDTDICNK
jgi:general secretion pathway protein G